MNNGTLTPYLEKLPEYLRLNGIDIQLNSSGKCPFKQHKTPKPFRVSMGSNDDPVWHCFACGKGGSIFELASELHGLPQGNDPLFYDVTVRHLADELGLPFPEKKVKRTPDDQYKVDLYNATRELSNQLSYEPVKEYAKKRGWDRQLLKQFKVGGIANFEKVLEYLSSQYSKKVLKDIGFLTKNPHVSSIFADNRIIFTLHDEHGRPVGFTARAMEDTSDRKYVNSYNSMIFSKRNVLYNIHKAKASLNKSNEFGEHSEHRVLYMVEGQADVLALNKAGIKNVVAISGTSFTDEHIKLIEGFDIVISCLDADDGGSRATRNLYTKYQKTTKKHLYLLQLPAGEDPDSFINAHGIDKFTELKPILPIEWEILNEPTLKNTLLADYWLPFIVNTNSLYHQNILKTLSVKSGVSIKDLQIRLNTLVLEKAAVLQKGVFTGNIKLSLT